MKHIPRFLLVVSLFAATQLRAQDVSAVTISATTPDAFSISDFVVGWDFTVSAPVVVIALGYYDLNGDGLAVSHQVGIWGGPDIPLANDPALVQTTVPAGTAGLLQDSFRYEMLETPLTLVPGVTYTIGGYTQTSAQAGTVDPYFSQLTSDKVVFAPDIVFQVARTSTINQTALVRPVVPQPGSSIGIFGPSFLAQPIPEPSSLVLGAVGLGIAGAVGVARGKRKG